MENTISSQAYSFFIYFISGMIIGIIFDIFRILRKSFKTKDFVTYIEDILFWIITGIFLIFILFKFSFGQIRFYTIFALIIGFVLYLFTISKLFIKVSVIIILFIKKIVGKILRILFYPIKILFKPFSFFVINIRKVFRFQKLRQKSSKKL